MPLKSELTPIQESTLADAIESGAIFDNANRVDDAATYATVTALPTNAMANRGISVPKSLITLAKPVIGTLDDNCHAQCGQTEIDNGAQFLKDVARTGETGNTVGHVVGDYLGVDEDDEDSELPEEIAADIVDTEKELRGKVLEDLRILNLAFFINRIVHPLKDVLAEYAPIQTRSPAVNSKFNLLSVYLDKFFHISWSILSGLRLR